MDYGLRQCESVEDASEGTVAALSKAFPPHKRFLYDSNTKCGFNSFKYSSYRILLRVYRTYFGAEHRRFAAAEKHP